MEEQAARLLEASHQATREQTLPLIQRGQAAEALLGNTVLVEWFKDSQDSLLELVDTVPLNDTVARDRIYSMLALLRKLRLSLEHYVEEGKMAKEELHKFLELEKKGFLGRLLDNV